MTDADWLAAVAAAPDEPLVRLAYADWLDDHGDPRAELLRLDVELAGREDDDSNAEPLRKRLAELVPGVDLRWRAAVCRLPLSFDGWTDSGACLCGLLKAPYEVYETGLIWAEPPGYHVLIRQPVNRFELALLCDAARCCADGDMRYEGTDPVVLRMMGRWPADHEPVPSSEPTGMLPATFRPPPSDSPWLAASQNWRRHSVFDREWSNHEIAQSVCLVVALAALAVFVALAYYLQGVRPPHV